MRRPSLPIVLPTLLVASIVWPYFVFDTPIAIAISLVGTFAVGRWASWRQRPHPNSESDREPPRTLRLPLSGTWRAIHTPDHRVPSHGTHFLAQTYAFDFLTAEDDEPPRTWRRRLWPRQPETYAAFDQPVISPASGEIVSVSDHSRDHRGRNSAVGMVVFFAEQLVRSFLGARGMLGNHVVVRLDDTSHALFAHLRKGSTAVRVGEQVGEGQILGRCGNSGNSSEPHLHFQLMDGADIWNARGYPVTFRGYEVRRSDGGWDAVDNGIPRRGQPIRSV